MTQLFTRNIIKPAVTFDPIYELGRKLQPSQSIVFHELDTNEAAKLAPLIRSFLSFIQKDASSSFTPALAELSLFDPADPSGNRFYTLLVSNSRKHIESYIEEMRANMDAELPSRGVILPHENLYTAPYYYGKFSRESYSTFNALDTKSLHIQIGSFEVVQLESEDNKQVNSYVTGFFEAVKDQIKDPKGSHDLNTALLIPLYRPAAPIDQNQQSIFRGGGLFLFGYADKTFNVDAFALELQSLLLKLVFEASHSQIEVEKLKFLQANLELGTYHHFSTNLRKIPGYLNPENFGMDNLNEAQIKKLSILSDSLNYCIDNILSGLNSYKAFLTSEEDQEKQYSTVEGLVEQLEKHRLAVAKHDFLHSIRHQNLNIEVDPEIRTWKLPMAVSALLPHLLELLSNIEKEYEVEEIPLKDRNISISVRKKSERFIEFTISNSCTNYNQFVIDNAGKRPLNSVASSGLGLYFLNFSLGLLGAIQDLNQGRYFSLINDGNPRRANLSFTFEIPETTQS